MTYTFNPHHPVVREDIEAILAAPLPWDQLKGKHVLLTGGNGMFGSYLALSLLALARTQAPELRLTLLVRSRARLEAKLGPALASDLCHIVEGELDAPPALPAGQPDIIIHAASPATPRDYATNPVGVIRANAMGTFALLERYAREHPVRFLMLGSGVYGESDNIGPVDENAFGAVRTLDPRNCYIESKRMAENLLACWRRQYGIDFGVARIFHTFGPGVDLHDGRIFSDLIKAALNRQAMVLTSDGSAKRTFCYLADAVSALFHILLKGESGSAYNVGNSANELSIRDFTTLGAALCEPPLPVVFGAVDPSIYLPATTRRGHPVTTLIESLGWKPAHDVADALSRTYRSFLP